MTLPGAEVINAGLIGDEIFLLVLGFGGDNGPLAISFDRLGSSEEAGMVGSDVYEVFSLLFTNSIDFGTQLARLSSSCHFPVSIEYHPLREHLSQLSHALGGHRLGSGNQYPRLAECNASDPYQVRRQCAQEHIVVGIRSVLSGLESWRQSFAFSPQDTSRASVLIFPFYLAQQL